MSSKAKRVIARIYMIAIFIPFVIVFAVIAAFKDVADTCRYFGEAWREMDMWAAHCKLGHPHGADDL